MHGGVKKLDELSESGAWQGPVYQPCRLGVTALVVLFIRDGVGGRVLVPRCREY